MSANNEVLKKMISACDPLALRALLNDLGYPRQPITPSLLERVHREQEEEFTPAFAKLVKQGITKPKLDNATGDGNTFDDWLNGTGDWATQSDTPTSKSWGSTDYKNILDGLGGLAKNVLPYLQIDMGGGQSAVARSYYNSIADRANAAASVQINPYPWIIGGLIVVAIIVVIVTTKR
ncbi:MAG: hypothetical protein WCJ03_12555 [Bacteroidales bacterium]